MRDNGRQRSSLAHFALDVSTPRQIEYPCRVLDGSGRAPRGVQSIFRSACSCSSAHQALAMLRPAPPLKGKLPNGPPLALLNGSLPIRGFSFCHIYLSRSTRLAQHASRSAAAPDPFARPFADPLYYSQTATSQINGHGQTLLPVGVYAPLNTFFDPVTEDLDLETFKKHALRIAQAGGELQVWEMYQSRD